MEKLTQEFLDELLTTQEKVNRLHEELSDFIYKHEKWKANNLGKSPNHVENEMVDICVENGKLMIDTYDKRHDLYEQGDLYEYETYCWSLTELMTDDWKEPALKEYQKTLEKRKEAQRIKEEKLAKEIEEKELAEFKRLQKKYG